MAFRGVDYFAVDSLLSQQELMVRQTARRFAELYQSEHLETSYPHVIAAHPAIPYFLNIDPNRNAREDAFTASRIKHPPPAALLIWEKTYCTTNAIAEDAATPDQLKAAGWLEDPQLTQRLNDGSHSTPWIVFKSPTSRMAP